MKTVLALTAGALLALVPTSTALAGDVPGKAYGNCQHSSSVGDPHSALLPDVGSGKGNGGLVELAKGGTGCVTDGTVVDPDPKDPKDPKGPKAPTGPKRPTDPVDPPMDE